MEGHSNVDDTPRTSRRRSRAGRLHRPQRRRSESGCCSTPRCQGPVSFFLLAVDRGYLKEAGSRFPFSTGGGAAVIVPQVQEGAYDAGYGDITALIDRIARGPVDTGPVAVWTTFNRTPFTIAVDARGPIRTAADLAAAG